MEQIQMYYDEAIRLAIGYLPKVGLAFLTLLIGLQIIRWIVKGLDKSMTFADADVSLQRFLLSLARVGLKLLLLISVASMIGIETTSFIAVLGAAGLAIGLALQGSLSNFAGGVLILVFKPFKVGDFLEAQGHKGTVNEIQIFNTVLKTPDNKTIIIPNGALSNGSMINYSTEPTRRVDMVFGIGYGDDIAKAKSILQRLIQEDQRILKTPEPQVVVGALADSSVNFTVRVWSAAGDYWGIYFDMHEKVKLVFDQEGISIPFPQRDVHLHKAFS